MYIGDVTSLGFSYFFAVMVIVLAIFHLAKELYQAIRAKWDYFRSLQNWNEIFLFLLSIIYVFIFANDCGCPTLWQWQVGIFAVFLAWINLIIIAAEIPRIGIFILIFKEIWITFMKLVLFSLILVAAFAIILFMMFYSPTAKVSIRNERPGLL